MFTYPVWSTWAQYKDAINQTVVLEYAEQIVANGFADSQLEIDDRWETSYGDLTFDAVNVFRSVGDGDDYDSMGSSVRQPRL